MYTALVTLLVAALVLALRQLRLRRYERRLLERHPLGAAGIMHRAAAIERPGDGARGVLLLHGFGDTPQTLHYLADALASAGFGVHAPLLPGHGRSLRAFSSVRAEDWVQTARAGLLQLRARTERVAIVGLSMGGALATILAAERPELPAVGLLAPYLAMPDAVARAARAWWLWGPLLGYLDARGQRSIHDPEEQARSLAYGAVTAPALRELRRVVEWAHRALPRVTAPALVIQSREDNRIEPEAAERAFERLGSDEKRLVWLEGSGHIITVDRGRDDVFALLVPWLERHVRASPTGYVRGASAG